MIKTFDGVAIEVKDGFDPDTASARELSELVLAIIEQNPEKWDQSNWHYNGCHCYMGWTEIILGITPTGNCLQSKCYLQERLNLSEINWYYLSAPDVSLVRLKALHKMLFIDGVYGNNGFDDNGFDFQGYDSEGYNSEGYNKLGYNRQGFDEDGFDIEGFDQDGFNIWGFDKNGFDREGYNEDGFNYEGYDRYGYDAYGRYYYGDESIA